MILKKCEAFYKSFGLHNWIDGRYIHIEIEND